MGRKKRRVSSTEDADAPSELPTSAPPQPAASSSNITVQPPTAPAHEANASNSSSHITQNGEKEAAKASYYAVASHSGDMVEEDIYVSDGSEDEEDNVDVVLSGSKMGLMRRGLHQPLQLVQPNLRQWVRPDGAPCDGGEAIDAETEQQRQRKEEELSKLDPAERAARLLAEKQRKLEEAKESARRLESEENAGRDPCLFSKRTAFDIRFDQIDDKPWERGAGDLTDFFNYGLTVESWLEYAQQQLTIRQELTDASRQKRPPDPNIVPVTARKPKSQTPKVAVASSGDSKQDEDNAAGDDMNDDDGPVIGPTLVQTEESDDEKKNGGNLKEAVEENGYSYQDVPVGTGGAWGAGAAEDSVLARLIEEQTQKESGDVAAEATQSHNNFGGGGEKYCDRSPMESNYDDVSVQPSAGGDSYAGYENDDFSHGGFDENRFGRSDRYNQHDGAIDGRFNSFGNDSGRGGRFSKYGSRGRFNAHGSDGRGSHQQLRQFQQPPDFRGGQGRGGRVFNAPFGNAPYDGGRGAHYVGRYGNEGRGGQCEFGRGRGRGRFPGRGGDYRRPTSRDDPGSRGGGGYYQR